MARVIQEIFRSLPGAGDILAPALLAHFGDDRERFPSAASVQPLAGTCPVTEQSGKRRIIRFRTACDHHFRDIAQQWAKASLKHSVWAQAYWQQTRPHCQSDSHAYRCLANRWLAIVWKLWQSHQAHDEAYHLQQRLQRRQPLAELRMDASKRAIGRAERRTAHWLHLRMRARHHVSGQKQICNPTFLLFCRSLQADGGDQLQH